jgi:hypothetical protein
MLSESPTDIVGWSHDGLSFAVINAEKFAEQIIPRYFKHKNLASFVRQLNFYGFRKVKNHRNTVTEEDVIEFKHPQFQRDRPDLLSEIKRAANTGETPDINEYNHVKYQVNELTGRVDELSRSIQELRQMMGHANHNTANQNLPQIEYIDQTSKRQRYDSRPPLEQEIYDVPDDDNLGEDEFDQDTIDMLADFDTSIVTNKANSMPVSMNTVNNNTMSDEGEDNANSK